VEASSEAAESKVSKIVLLILGPFSKKFTKNEENLHYILEMFKGTGSPVQNCLKVVCMDRPWLGHPSQ